MRKFATAAAVLGVVFACLFSAPITEHVRAQGASTGSFIPELPQRTTVADGDWFVFESVAQAVGQKTSKILASDAANYFVSKLAAVTLFTGTTGQTVPLNNGGFTQSGDAFFSSGKPWIDVRANPFNAVGDGVTDDTAAINAAIAAAAAIPGGATVFFPPESAIGGYCTFTGITISNANLRVSGSSEGTKLSACGHNITPLTINSGQIVVDNMLIDGAQIIGGVAPTADAFVLGLGCSTCHAFRVKVRFGRHAVNFSGSDDVFFDSTATFAYGSSVLYDPFNATISHSIVDQNLPGLTPTAYIAAPVAWQASHAYATTGTLVNLTTGGATYRIQLMSGACTSNSAQPALASYLTDMPDNNCTWRLASGATPYFGVQFDTGDAASWVIATDISGAPYDYGIGFTNTLAGTAPQSTTLLGVNIGDEMFGLIYAHDGSGAYITGGNFGGCKVTGCILANLNGSWAGDFHSVNAGWNQGAIGISIAAGINNTVIGGHITGTATEAILVANGVNQGSILGVGLGTSGLGLTNPFGIVFAGASTLWDVFPNCGALTAANCVNGSPGAVNRSLEQGSTLLAVLTASSSATLADTTHFTAAYDDYELVFDNVVPATNAVAIEVQLHSGGIFQTTGYLNLAGGITAYGDLIGGAATTLSNAAGLGFSGRLTIHNVNSASVAKIVDGIGAFYNGTLPASPTMRSIWNATAAVDGFQVLMSTGNIASGTIKVFGVRNAL